MVRRSTYESSELRVSFTDTTLKCVLFIAALLIFAMTIFTVKDVLFLIGVLIIMYVITNMCFKGDKND